MTRGFTVCDSGAFLGDDPLSGLQQRLPVAHVGLRARAGECGAAGRRQLLQPEEVQAAGGAPEEAAAAEAATPVPAALALQGGVRPQEPQPGRARDRQPRRAERRGKSRACGQRVRTRHLAVLQNYSS